jgi:ribosomal protein S18 acetylase RimI-like enzyme
VWLIESTDGSLLASMILRPRKRSLVLFSVASHPAGRGRGLGGTLLALALRRTRELGLTETVLEVATDLPGLLAWYQRHGFRPRRHLRDYYAPGHHAWRMHRPLPDHE